MFVQQYLHLPSIQTCHFPRPLGTMSTLKTFTSNFNNFRSFWGPVDPSQFQSAWTYLVFIEMRFTHISLSLSLHSIFTIVLSTLFRQVANRAAICTLLQTNSRNLQSRFEQFPQHLDSLSFHIIYAHVLFTISLSVVRLARNTQIIKAHGIFREYIF